MSACMDGFHFVVLDNLVNFVVHCHVAQLMGSYAWTFHRGPEQLGEYVWHWDLRTRAASVVANGFIIVRSLSALCFPVACVDRLPRPCSYRSPVPAVSGAVQLRHTSRHACMHWVPAQLQSHLASPARRGWLGWVLSGCLRRSIRWV